MEILFRGMANLSMENLTNLRSSETETKQDATNSCSCIALFHGIVSGMGEIIGYILQA